ncbi:hypothetical protein Hypma_008995 [Hypsizygus marmoreus]|uniref:Uncharacterized protein n=1 Tax=Hypsizygus marmoreus TaxID=39966 RepID=A0A369JUG8_HYPMA|nr:hypothetical protein Hypma_008995 [Hypsizygus marmoreus]
MQDDRSHGMFLDNLWSVDSTPEDSFSMGGGSSRSTIDCGMTPLIVELFRQHATQRLQELLMVLRSAHMLSPAR